MELHKHHIVPKHMGGTDEDSNIIMLTRDEHAAAHLELYEKYGKKEDLWAAHILGRPQDISGDNNPMRRPEVVAKRFAHKLNYNIGSSNPNYGRTAYVVVDPEGKEHIVKHGIKQWCKDRGLNHENIRKVATGKRKHHKGYTAKILGD